MERFLWSTAHDLLVGFTNGFMVSGMNSLQDLRAEKAKRILSENQEGLESLAAEEPARMEREHPYRAKVKRFYRKYIKRPKASPMVI